VVVVALVVQAELRLVQGVQVAVLALIQPRVQVLAVKVTTVEPQTHQETLVAVVEVLEQLVVLVLAVMLVLVVLV
jgi:hypothetical protein